MDSPLDHKPVRRQARALLESRREMIRAEAADRRQLGEAELAPEMRVDVLEHAPQPVQRKAAALIVECSHAVAIFAQQMDGERGREAVSVDATGGTTRRQFSRGRGRETLDDGIGKVDTVPDLELAHAVESLSPDHL